MVQQDIESQFSLVTTCKELCEGVDEEARSLEFLLKKLNKDYYDLSIHKSGKKTIIQFEFASDCCRRFEGKFSLRKDTLYLHYFDVENVICECYCSYIMRYELEQKEEMELSWKKLIIKEGKIETL